MKRPLAPLTIASLLAAAMSVAVRPAEAQLAVVASSDSQPQIDQLQVATTVEGPTSTTWSRLRVTSASKQTWLLIVPVRTGDRVNIVSEAWFEALEVSTTPRLLPPEQPPDRPCGQLPPSGTVLTADDLAHDESLKLALNGAVMNVQVLFSYAKTQGVSLQQASWAWQLSELDQRDYRFLVFQTKAPAGQLVFPTVRVSSPSPDKAVPLLLNEVGSVGTKVTAWLFGSQPKIPSNLPWTTVDESNVSWVLGDKSWSTSYEDELSQLIDQSHGNVWVVEDSEHLSLATTKSAANGTVDIPALGTSYFERFDAYSTATLPVSQCVTSLKAIETSDEHVSTACAQEALVTVPDSAGQPPPKCEETTNSGDLAPDSLRCNGKAEDLALALSGLVPTTARITRWTGQLRPWTTRATQETTTEDILDVSTVLTCGDWDTSACEPEDAGAGGSGGAPSSNTGGNTGASGNTAAGGGPHRYYDPDDIAADRDPGSDVYVEGSCWGPPSPQPPPDESSDDSTCDGDSSSSSGNDETCSGDSSSSSSGDDTSCSGDSSSSSSGDDETCSGDSSSSSSGDDETCSGDSSSSSSGDDTSCDGGDTSGDSSDCSISKKKRRRRIPSLASAWLIALLLLPIRRRFGRKRRSSRSQRDR